MSGVSVGATASSDHLNVVLSTNEEEVRVILKGEEMDKDFLIHKRSAPFPLCFLSLSPNKFEIIT